MKKSIFQKAASFIMACAITASAAISTAFAADPTDKYTLTITGATKPANYTGDPKDEPYQAYQLFSGTVGEVENQLIGVKWGSGFDTDDDGYYPGTSATPGTKQVGVADDGIPDSIEAFLAALKAETSAFQVNVETDPNADPQMENAFKDVKSAITLAQALDKYGPKATTGGDNSEFMIAFANIAADYLTVPFAGQTYDWSVADTLKIGNLDGGYYLLKDNTKNDGDYIYSQYILDVPGTESVALKKDAPTLDKEITAVNGKDEGISNDKDSAAVGVGSTVKFTLTGTLPSNYDNFATYKYVFTDKLPDALTLKPDTVKLYVVNAAGKYEIKILDDANANVSKAFTGNVLTVTIKDLKLVSTGSAVGSPDGYVQNITIDESCKILVEYDTIVNKNAVETDLIQNEAKLTFSNDPNSTGSGTSSTTSDTPESYTKVFAYEIEIDKNDGDIPETKQLGNVGFTVTRGENDAKETAIFRKTSDGKYTFIAWVATASADYFTGDKFNAAAWAAVKENEALLKDIFGDGADVWDDEEKAFTDGFIKELCTEVFTSTASTNLGRLNLQGLAPGSYTFSESSPLTAYEAVKDFVVTLVAEVEWTVTDDEEVVHTVKGTVDDFNSCAVGSTVKDINGAEVTVTSISATYQYTGILSVTTNVDNVNGNNVTMATPENKVAKLNVIDDPKSVLPSTGGAGAWFYYICGGLLVVTSVAVLVFNRKKSDKKS